MHPQEQISLELQLETLKKQRNESITDFDSKIQAIEKQLGLPKPENTEQTPAQRFQAEREAASRMTSPFTFSKK